MAARSPLVEFIIANQSSLINIDLCREIWMIPERLVGSRQTGDKFRITTECPLYLGKLFILDHNPDRFYAVTSFTRVYDTNSGEKAYEVTATDTGIIYTPGEKLPLCTPQDSFILNPGEILNYKGSEPVDTSIGIFITNYLLLVYPFGDVIGYMNTEIKISMLEKKIAYCMINNQVTIRDVKDKYINTLSLFGQACEMVNPGISEKTITIPQSITDLRERLVRENREAIEAGDVAVMSDIEKQLIAAYRTYLEGDPSMHFLLKAKYFNVTLKKLFLTQGMTEVFGSPGKFVFVDNPMGNGWKQKDLPTIFNEVRSGSYSRAIETADGGVIAKLILRVLQDTRIDTDDCGTTNGEDVFATKDSLEDFLWNYVVNKNGSTTLITEESIPSLVGKDLVIRTPGYCKATKGFCAKCFGNLFEELGQKAFAPVANDFARNQTTSALKAMHGKSHNTVDISNIDKYLIRA
jgi:hypothetical protein